eukprot:GHRR01023041.1.p1 GENE.GHRR01023041.1~~GHRR01023041.1.p1  ORF type:complete len:179 (+),score=71.26 GHRR01023041.1:274-810(+)
MDNRDALTQSVTSYAAKLLKRADQCRAACAASHLAWQESAPTTEGKSEGQGEPSTSGNAAAVRDFQKVMAGLKRALKVVAATKQQRAAVTRQGKAAGQHLLLYVEIANHYLYYFSKGVESMSTGVMQQLLELVASELAQHQADLDPDTKTYWEATKKHIQFQKSAETGAESKFAALNI